MTPAFAILAALLFVPSSRAQLSGCEPWALDIALSPACVPTKRRPCATQLSFVRLAEKDCLLAAERLLAQPLPSEMDLTIVADALDQLLAASRAGRYGYRAGFTDSRPSRLREAQRRAAGPSPKGDPFCRAGVVRRREPVLCDGKSAQSCAAALERLEEACRAALARARDKWRLAAQGRGAAPVDELEGVLDNALALREAGLRRPGYRAGLSEAEVSSELAAARILAKPSTSPAVSRAARAEALPSMAVAMPAAPFESPPEPPPVRRWTPVGWILGVMALFIAAAALFIRGWRDDAAAPALLPAPPTPGAPPLPGELVAGRYLVKEEIRGAADPGWAALDQLTGDAVTLRGPSHGAAFEEDARRVAALDHPGAARVRGSTRDPRGLFLVGDRVEGATLAASCAAHGPFEPAFVKRIVGQACAALEAAHALGLAHGGLCAERLLLDGEASLKILGFGPMRSLVGGEAAAPEAEPSASADLYSLACVAYLLLFKVPPFSGPDAGALKAAGEFVSASNRRAGLPLALDLFFTRALNPRRAERFRSAGEFRAEFERALSSG